MSKSENTTKVECLVHTEDPILTKWKDIFESGRTEITTFRFYPNLEAGPHSFIELQEDQRRTSSAGCHGSSST